VRAALAGFVLLQADVTKNDDDDQALMRRYRIVGPPDTLFYGADGAERPALQLAGFEETAKFLERVSAATKEIGPRLSTGRSRSGSSFFGSSFGERRNDELKDDN